MSYTHLTAQERYVISHLNGRVSIREIARRLNRHHTTISRELHRAKSHHPLTVYWYYWTHPLALEKRSKARHYVRQHNIRLVHYVETRLERQWSPEEISQRLRIDYPDDERMRISQSCKIFEVIIDTLKKNTQ